MVIYVKSILYKFDDIFPEKKSSYIFQYVSKRKLTSIYHAHDFFEITIQIKGTVIEYVNGQERLLKKGAVSILKPNDSHCYLSQSEDAEIICLSVEKSEAINLLSDFNTDFDVGNILFYNEDIIRKISEFITATKEEYHYKLLFCLIICQFLDIKNNTVPFFLKNALNEFHTYENQRLGIPRLVELSGYSRSHLTRIVRKYCGVSLQQLIMDIRLDTAYKDILLLDSPIEEIAYDVGYSSFSHFNKIFKNKFQITPALLRKSRGMFTV